MLQAYSNTSPDTHRTHTPDCSTSHGHSWCFLHSCTSVSISERSRAPGCHAPRRAAAHTPTGLSPTLPARGKPVPRSIRPYMLTRQHALVYALPAACLPEAAVLNFSWRCDVRPAVSSCRQHTSRAGPAFSDPAHVSLSPGRRKPAPCRCQPRPYERLCDCSAALHAPKTGMETCLTTDLRTGPQTNPEGSCCSSQTVPANRYVSQTFLVCSYVTSSLHR